MGLAGSVPVHEKKSDAVANAGRLESSGDGLAFDDTGNCSFNGDVKASKNRLSSSTGVKTGSTLVRLDFVLSGAFPYDRADKATGEPLACLSRFAAALCAGLKIMVAEPSEVCFLCPKRCESLGSDLGAILSNDCEVGNTSGAGKASVLYTASGDSASRSKRESSNLSSSLLPCCDTTCCEFSSGLSFGRPFSVSVDSVRGG